MQALLFPFCFALQIDARGSRYLEFFLPARASNPPTLNTKSSGKSSGADGRDRSATTTLP